MNMTKMVKNIKRFFKFSFFVCGFLLDDIFGLEVCLHYKYFKRAITLFNLLTDKTFSSSAAVKNTSTFRQVFILGINT